jgi:hypothetical protein
VQKRSILIQNPIALCLGSYDHSREMLRSPFERVVVVETCIGRIARNKKNVYRSILIKNGKAIPVTRPRGPYFCETLRLPHFLDSRLTDGGEVVSLTRRPPFTPGNIPGTRFC